MAQLMPGRSVTGQVNDAGQDCQGAEEEEAPEGAGHAQESKSHNAPSAHGLTYIGTPNSQSSPLSRRKLPHVPAVTIPFRRIGLPKDGRSGSLHSDAVPPARSAVGGCRSPPKREAKKRLSHPVACAGAERGGEATVPAAQMPVSLSVHSGEQA